MRLQIKDESIVLRYTVVFVLVNDGSCRKSFNNKFANVITQCIYNIRCVELQHNSRLVVQLAKAVCKFKKRYLKVGFSN